jgi:hypothetical protein
LLRLVLSVDHTRKELEAFVAVICTFRTSMFRRDCRALQ